MSLYISLIDSLWTQMCYCYFNVNVVIKSNIKIKDMTSSLKHKE